MTAPELLEEVPELDPVEQRILGSLLEKQRTVPASYPLTQNALRTACNQSSSRDPVVDYDDRTVLDGLARLKERGLIRTVWAGAGSRVLKYHQRLEERLGLAADHRALLTLLLLRGPQAPGELRSRAERLHPFARPRRGRGLPAGDGRRCRCRWSASWPGSRGSTTRAGRTCSGRCPQPVAAAVAEPAVDRDVVLRDGPATPGRAGAAPATTRSAGGYAERFADELAEKPFDRWLLDRVAELAGPGPVADVGCGPGHTTAHLAAAGPAVVGFDLVAGHGRRRPGSRFPDVEFEVGDLRSLLRPPAAPAWQAVVAWYALVHLAGSELAAARGRADPGAGAGRLAGARAARRRRGVARRRAVRRARRPRLRAARPGRGAGRGRPRPGWSTSSGTCAGRSATPRPGPNGCTCWPAGRRLRNTSV